MCISGHKYAGYLIISLLICIMRILVPYEADVGANIRLGWWITPFFLFWWKTYRILGHDISVGETVLFTLMAISSIKVMVVIGQYYLLSIKAKKLLYSSAVYDAKLYTVVDLTGINLIVSDEVPIPMSIGFIKKYILMPTYVFSEDEKKCILEHEKVHLHNHDSWIKLFIRLVCSFYWFIPFIAIIEKDVDELIEIRCDAKVVKHMDENEKICYLQTMSKILKRSVSIISTDFVAVAFSKPSRGLIGERIKEIIDDSEPDFMCKILPLILLILISASYLVSIRPYMDTPANYYDDSDGYVFSPDNTYLQEIDDNDYKLIRYDGICYPISQYEAQKWLEDVGKKRIIKKKKMYIPKSMEEIVTIEFVF